MRRRPAGIWMIQSALTAMCLLSATCLAAENHLAWDQTQNRVTANIQSEDLTRLLGQITAATGWQVYLEPGVSSTRSAKFTNLPSGEALRMLLGNLNFALVPQTNAAWRLYVFHTSRGNATRLIHPIGPRPGASNTNAIANQVIVRLNPGASIEELARRLGAKIIGRIDALGIYLLEFPNAADAQAARNVLVQDPEVAGIDSNYLVNPPPQPQQFADGLQPAWNLQPKESSGPCKITIGLIDTPVTRGNGLDPFLLPPISAAGSPAAPSADLTHGTAMAEAILQSIQNNADASKTSVKILPVDVFGQNPDTSTFNVGQGIYEAVKAGANIINLSLGGGGDSPFLHDLIAQASKQGVLFFAAAGNQPVTSPTYPAAYPEVLAVTASDPNGQIANYANRGSFVSLMAPGTSLADFQGQLYLVNGTSSATAIASGFAAGMADNSHECPDQVVGTVRGRWGVNFNPAP